MEDVTSDVIMVMRTTLSKKEFASALGMSDTDVFVLKMFNIVDRDGDGRISFQEFLDTIVLFSKVMSSSTTSINDVKQIQLMFDPLPLVTQKL